MSGNRRPPADWHACGSVAAPYPRKSQPGESLFELQEFAEGSPVDELTEDTLRPLIDVVRTQRGACLGAGWDWWEFLTDGIVAGP